MIEAFFDPQNLLALATLALLEIILGIDNLIFISIVTQKLPEDRRAMAWKLGLSIALFMRIGLLMALTWVMGLKEPLIELMGRGFSGRDLFLLAGGLFLLAKATSEIHEKLEVDTPKHGPAFKASSLGLVLLQILALDLVFSVDSILTAIGMAEQLWVMIAAIVIAIGVMLASAQPLSQFINRHPTLQMLALSFLILIGVMLVAEGFGQHISKGYIYFALGFSLGVEFLNLKLRKRHAPIQLHESAEITPPPSH